MAGIGSVEYALYNGGETADETVGETIPEIRIAILRNIVIEPIAPYLKVHCSRHGMRLSLKLGDYDNLQQDVFQAGSPLFEFKPDIVVLALHLQLLAPKLVLGYTSLTPAESDELSTTVLERVEDLVQPIEGIHSRDSGTQF